MTSGKEKCGELLIVFGTTVPAAEKAYRILEQQIQLNHPDSSFQIAYLSSFVRQHLQKKGRFIPDVLQAWKQLQKEGCHKIRNHMGLLTIGEEFFLCRQRMAAYAEEFQGIEFSYSLPPLSNPDTVSRFASYLLHTIPNDYSPEHALLFMGHGHSLGYSDFAYSALENELRKQNKQIFLATVEGSLSLERTLLKMKQQNIRHATLRSLMIVAGNHALNDMAGDHPLSWKNRLANQGISSEIEWRGLAEYPELANLITECFE